VELGCRFVAVGDNSEALVQAGLVVDMTFRDMEPEPVLVWARAHARLRILG